MEEDSHSTRTLVLFLTLGLGVDYSFKYTTLPSFNKITKSVVQLSNAEGVQHPFDEYWIENNHCFLSPDYKLTLKSHQDCRATSR